MFDLAVQWGFMFRKVSLRFRPGSSRRLTTNMRLLVFIVGRLSVAYTDVLFSVTTHSLWVFAWSEMANKPRGTSQCPTGFNLLHQNVDDWPTYFSSWSVSSLPIQAFCNVECVNASGIPCLAVDWPFSAQAFSPMCVLSYDLGIVW